MATIDLSTQAHEIAMEVLRDPSRPDRASGDCFAGARAAGADEETALQIAKDVHSSPELRGRLSTAGEALLGAEVALLLGAEQDG